ncbi:MAG TPA: sialidase family protein [Candidatus Saccharimonadia bacterium]|nr:sialidase family protein [Candidatus Saccharimonadia bacterium]
MSRNPRRLIPFASQTALAWGFAAACCAAPALAQHGASAAPGVAHFDVYGDGADLHVLLGERVGADKTVQLSHRRSVDGGATWSAPVRIDRPGDTLFSPHPGEHPQLAARGDRIVVLWTSRNPESGRGGAIVSAVSPDGGASWSRGATPAGDDSQAYHGLLELASDESGFHAVWLRPNADAGNEAQGLHYAHSQDGAQWAAQRALDLDTCRCCWNRLVTTGDGVGVLYRDGTPRDMAFVALRDGEWSKPVAAGDFGWRFEGCPHVGGALASDHAKRLDALVWTGVDEARAGLYHVASRDAGASWTEPRRIGDAGARESDLLLADGKLVALWSTVADGKSRVHRAESSDGGKNWDDARAVSSAAANATQPRVVAARGKPVSFWLERAGSGGASLVVDGRPFGAAAH